MVNYVIRVLKTKCTKEALLFETWTLSKKAPIGRVGEIEYYIAGCFKGLGVKFQK